MLQSGLFMQAARSHTRSCVNLHQSDISLHQQVGQSHFHHILSALRRILNPPHYRSTIPERASCSEPPPHHPAACCHLRRAVHFPGHVFRRCCPTHPSRRLSRSLKRSMAPAAGAACCTRTKAPGLEPHSPEAPSQLPSFTLSGILPATQEGPQNLSPRDSQRCPQLIPTPPPHAPYLPWGNTDYYLPKEGGEVQW